MMRAALQVENLLQMIAGVTAEFKDILDKYAAAYEYHRRGRGYCS
ncbi:MAG: hypothetical protein ACLTIG_04685 [Roseburia hominis]